MSDEIVKPAENAINPFQQASQEMAIHDNKEFAAASKSRDYLCRLQLCGSKSTLFSTNKVQRGDNVFIVNKDKFTNLGQTVDLLIMAWRPKALDMNEDPPLSFYDMDSAGFKDVQLRSKDQNSRCSWGPEYLVWIPQIKEFSTMHLGSATMRGDAPDLHKLMGLGCTLGWRVAGPNKKGQTWDSWVFSPCSSPFENPTIEEYKKMIEKFQLEAKAKAPEKVEATPSDGRAR